jgi:uncharacterized membrane protein
MEYFMPLTVFAHMVTRPVQAGLALGVSMEDWLRWWGNYHYIFVHFPIALIVMAGVAEILFSWKKDPKFNVIVNFLLISAAILVIPTVASGLSLKESGAVSEEMLPLLEWHEIFGFVTFTLTLITVILRFWLGRSPLYLCSLFVLLICVIVTAYIGGLMAFGDVSPLPPIFQ